MKCLIFFFDKDENRLTKDKKEFLGQVIADVEFSKNNQKNKQKLKCYPVKSATDSATSSGYLIASFHLSPESNNNSESEATPNTAKKRNEIEVISNVLPKKLVPKYKPYRLNLALWDLEIFQNDTANVGRDNNLGEWTAGFLFDQFSSLIGFWGVKFEIYVKVFIFCKGKSMHRI